MIPDGSFDYFGTCLALLLVFPVIFDFRRRAQSIFRQKIKAQLKHRIKRRLDTLVGGDSHPEKTNYLENRARDFRDAVDKELKKQGISLQNFLVSTTFATCVLFVLSLIVFALCVTKLIPTNLNLYKFFLVEHYPFSEDYTAFISIFTLPLIFSLITGHVLIWRVKKKYYEQIEYLSEISNEKISPTTKPLINSAINRQAQYAWTVTIFVLVFHPVTAPFFVFFFLLMVYFAASVVYTTYRAYIKATINAMFD